MQAEREKSPVYVDGSGPRCKAEIGHRRPKDQAGAICFVDVSPTDGLTLQDLTQRRAIERFHVRTGDGHLFSGTAAFVEVSPRLPKWRWAARAASLSGALPGLELGYRMFLPVRSFLSRLVGWVLRFKAACDEPERG